MVAHEAALVPLLALAVVRHDVRFEPLLCESFECRYLLFPERARQQSVPQVPFVLLGATPSLHGRDLADALRLAVGMLERDVHDDERPPRPGLGIATRFASNAHGFLRECET